MNKNPSRGKPQNTSYKPYELISDASYVPNDNMSSRVPSGVLYFIIAREIKKKYGRIGRYAQSKGVTPEWIRQCFYGTKNSQAAKRMRKSVIKDLTKNDLTGGAPPSIIKTNNRTHQEN